MPVLGSAAKHDGSERGGAILSLALLDAERRGVVALEAGKAGRLLGLRKVDALFVRPGPAAVEDAPPHGLGSTVRPFVAARPQPPEATAALARGVPAQPVRDLVERTRAQRPREWDLLQKAVRDAVARRAERDDGPDLD